MRGARLPLPPGRPNQPTGASDRVKPSAAPILDIPRWSVGTRHALQAPACGETALTSTAPKPGLSPKLQLSQRIESDSVVCRARLGLPSAASDKSTGLARAFTSVVVCASATDAEAAGETGSLRQAVWTVRTGNMVLELRNASSKLSASRIARIVEPVLTGYAAGSLEAARFVRGSDTVRMAMDASRTELADGGALVRVVLYGRSSSLPASAQTNQPSAFA